MLGLFIAITVILWLRLGYIGSRRALRRLEEEFPAVPHAPADFGIALFLIPFGPANLLAACIVFPPLVKESMLRKFFKLGGDQ